MTRAAPMTEPQDVLADLRWLSDEAPKLWWQPESSAEGSKSAHLKVRAIADAAIAALDAVHTEPLRAATAETNAAWFTGYQQAISDIRHHHALVRTPETLDGTTTDCPLEGVHEHAFRGPHRFREWEPGSQG